MEEHHPQMVRPSAPTLAKVLLALAFGFFGFFLTAGLLVGGTYMYFFKAPGDAAFMESAIEADGTVAEVDARTEYRTRRDRNDRTYQEAETVIYTTFAFKDGRGQTHKFTKRTSGRPYAEGDELVVSYLAERPAASARTGGVIPPEQARADAEKLGMFLLGGGLLMAVAYGFFLRWYLGQKNAHELGQGV